MSVAWVAGSVRARSLARRRLGTDVTRRLAGAGSLAEALQALEGTGYGRELNPDQALAEADHGIAAAILWDLRVLVGWLPPGGVQLLRALAAWFEIVNADELLAGMEGGQAGPTFTLGALATAWPRLRGAVSPAGLQHVLASSAWGDPGGDSALAIRLGMRIRWAARVSGFAEPARTWAAAGAALLVAGERFVAGRPLAPPVQAPARGLIGGPALTAGTVEAMAAALPARARWVLAGIHSPDDLWRAEKTWWERVEQDGFRLLGSSGYSSAPVLGTVAVLVADARRVRAALHLAARGGAPLEAYDALA